MVGSQPCAVNPPFHVNWRSPTLFSEASATVVFSASLISKIPKLPNEEFPSGSSAAQPFRELSINGDPSFVSMGTPLELPRSAQLLSMPPYPEAPQPGHSLGPHLRSRLVPHAWVVTEGVPQAPTGTVLSWGLRRRHPPHPSHQGMSVWLSVDSAPDAPIPQALPRPVPQSPLSP